MRKIRISLSPLLGSYQRERESRKGGRLGLEQVVISAQISWGDGGWRHILAKAEQKFLVPAGQPNEPAKEEDPFH